MTLHKLSCRPHDSASSRGEISSLWISAGKLHSLLLQWGGHLFVAVPLFPCVVRLGGVAWLCLTPVFSLAACPQGCLQCTHRDRCRLCGHGFFLKSGLCMPTCVPGFSGHSSNETCAGKSISAGRNVWWCEQSFLCANDGSPDAVDTCHVKLNVSAGQKPLVLHKALFVEHRQLGKPNS